MPLCLIVHFLFLYTLAVEWCGDLNHRIRMRILCDFIRLTAFIYFGGFASDSNI